MKIQHTLFASFGIVLLLSTALLAADVKTDYDRSTDFSQYKTYSWEKVQTQDPLWVDRIKEAVNAALTAKGLTPVESGGDIAILAMEMTQNHRTLNTYYDGFGGGFMGDYTGNAWDAAKQTLFASWSDTRNGTDTQDEVGGLTP